MVSQEQAKSSTTSFGLELGVPGIDGLTATASQEMSTSWSKTLSTIQTAGGETSCTTGCSGSTPKRLYQWSVTFCQKDGCIEHGVNFMGNDIGGQISASSDLNCQAKCFQNRACLFFTFRPSDGACWLKRSSSGRTPESDRVSGPRETLRSCQAGDCAGVAKQMTVNMCDFSCIDKNVPGDYEPFAPPGYNSRSGLCSNSDTWSKRCTPACQKVKDGKPCCPKLKLANHRTVCVPEYLNCGDRCNMSVIMG